MTDAESNGTWSVDEFLADYRPVTKAVRICARGDLLAELERLESELAAARERDQASDSLAEGGEAIAVAHKIAELQGEVRAHEREFVVQSIGDRAWSDLVAEHPPKKERNKSKPDRSREMPWDPEAFIPAALAASCVTPKLSIAQANKLIDRLSGGQLRKLIDAVILVNGGSDDIPKSAAGFVLQRSSEPNSRIASRSESPGLSSSDGL